MVQLAKNLNLFILFYEKYIQKIFGNNDQHVQIK